MNLGLAGKAVVITGASKGIGLTVAQGMIREGARVAAGARENTADLTALADQGDLAIVLGDLTTTAGCQALV
ncbi:MAG: SDR family NAD(P)-dependent oxidoreductase, partial [Trebonia sp.]